MKRILSVVLILFAMNAFASNMPLPLRDLQPFTMTIFGNSEVFDIVMYQKDGEWVIPVEELERMKIKGFSSDTAISKLGEFVSFNKEDSTVKLKLFSDLIPVNQISMGFKEERPAYLDKTSGFTTNYSLSYNSSKQVSGVFDSKLALADKDLTINSIASYANNKTKLLDLNAKRYDNKDSTYMQFGSNVSDAGFTSNPVRFLGFQYRKDTSLNPNFITSPKFSFEGENNLENSVAELWINNQKLYTTNLPYGKFKFDELYSSSLPTGDLVLKIKDLNGNEKLISQSIINTAGNLEEGLSDFSYDVGLMGDFYTQKGLIFSHKYSYGQTKTFTYSLKTDITKDIQRFGLTGMLGTQVGNFRANTSVSNAGNTFGLTYFGNYKDLSVSANMNFRNNFKPLSLINTTASTDVSKELSVNYRLFNNLSLRYNQALNENKTNHYTNERKALDLNYNATSSLNLIASVGKVNDQNNAYVGFNYNFDGKSVSAMAYNKDKQNSYTLNTAFNRQSNVGLAGNLRETIAPSGNTTELNMNYSGMSFDTAVMMSKSANSKVSYNTTLDGAITVANGLHFTKRINDSYSVVETELPEAKVQLNGFNYTANDSGTAVALSNSSFRNVAGLYLDETVTTAIYEETSKLYSQYKGFPTKVVFERQPNPFFIKIKNVDDKTISIADTEFYKLSKGYYMEKVKAGDYIIKTSKCNIPFSAKNIGDNYPTFELACPETAPVAPVAQVVESAPVAETVVEAKPLPAVKIAPVVRKTVKRVKFSELNLDCFAKPNAPKFSKEIAYYCAGNSADEFLELKLTYAIKHYHTKKDLLNMTCMNTVDTNNSETYECVQPKAKSYKKHKAYKKHKKHKKAKKHKKYKKHN